MSLLFLHQSFWPPRAQPLMWFFMAWRLFLAWPRPPAAAPTDSPDPCPLEWPDWPNDPSISRISLFIFAIRSLEQRERVRKERRKEERKWLFTVYCIAVRYSQGDDVGVGSVHSDGYGVLVVYVLGVVIRPALQEETHQPAATQRRNDESKEGALLKFYQLHEKTSCFASGTCYLI